MAHVKQSLIDAISAAVIGYPGRIPVQVMREFYAAKAQITGMTFRQAVKTVNYYQRTLSRDVREFYAGDMDTGAFIDDMIRLVEEQLTRAWNEGMRNNDLDPAKDMTEEWQAVLDGEINEEMEHILDFAQAIEDAAAAGKPVQQYLDRVQLWVNRYPDVVNLSMMTTSPEDRFVWRLGATEEHCATCAGLDGVVATGSDWIASGYRPQNPPNPELECGGWRCDCRLEYTEVSTPLTEGGIPQV